ncbi:MAG: HAD-IA family hydrolase [Gammaproteobacteria bacterium]|nr:HAD-IA family hydrolase [Gammaproteobacteria bacterium]
MNLPYKMLVFDWDGTLMDSQAEIVYCFQSAAKDLKLAVPPTEEIHKIIGIGMQFAVRAIFPGVQSDEGINAIIERYRHYYFHPEKVQSELFEGIYDMLIDLESQGYLLGVATSKGRRGLDESLERTRLNKVFHVTRCIDEAQSKPHPQMLLDAIDMLGVERDEALMIGDTEFDLQMANNAGVHGLGVKCGAHPEERLRDCKPVDILEHTREVSDWLLRKG